MDSGTYQDLQNGRWAAVNPDCCPCRGGGWLLSNGDTWHRCPQHGTGVPHPEDEGSSFDFDAHQVANYRRAYDVFRCAAMGAHFKSSFKAACQEKLETPDPSPADWARAAEEVATLWLDAREEAQAQAQGFSCALEARWAAEAQWEERERAG